MTSDPLLRTTSLSCGYTSGSPVLQDVSVALARGTFCCVVGSNGVGKSTLLQTIAGLLRPLKGETFVNERPVTRLGAGERARLMSVVLTGLKAPGYLSVESFVRLGRYPHLGFFGRTTAADREACENALLRTGISHLKSRWLSELSDGELQRAAIARGLSQSSDIILLDEPTAFLDASGRATIMRQMQRIAHESNRLVIATSHDIDLVLRTADTVVVIRDDRTIAIGSPEQLITSGELDLLFAPEALEFDRERGSFRFPLQEGPGVSVRGEDEHARWARHVVERIGFRPVSEHRACITVTPQKSQPRTWTIEARGRTPETEANGFADLAEQLRVLIASMNGPDSCR